MAFRQHSICRVGNIFQRVKKRSVEIEDYSLKTHFIPFASSGKEKSSPSGIGACHAY
jgi:hypothetical protein